MVTRNGIALVMLSASAFVLGRLFGLLELHVLGAGLLALVAVAVATVAVRPLELTIDRRVDPLRPEVGETARVLVGVTSAHRSALVELWEPVGEGTGAALHLAPLRRGRRVEAVYLLPTTRRGIVRVGPMSAHLGDPFGLASRHRYVAPAAEVVVHPRTIALALPDLTARGGRLARRLAERALAAPAADEFQGLRDYVPGDDLRRVHWGATARRGELLVRQHDARASLHVVVVLDLAATSYGDMRDEDADAGFELAVSAVTSLALAADPERPTMSLVTSDSERLPLDTAALDSTLERLAVIGASTSTITPSVTRPSSSLVLAVVATGAHGLDRARRLAVVAGPVDATVIVACGEHSSSSTGPRRGAAFVLAPHDLDDLAAQWSSLVGRSGSRS